MHVDTDLSAYLDGELAPADRALVDAHLAGCERCRARLTELRATVSLIGALAAPRPSRSLVPRITERFNWLRPLRSFSTVASGAFLLIFMVTAIARGGGGLGVGRGRARRDGCDGRDTAAGPSPCRGSASAGGDGRRDTRRGCGAPRALRDRGADVGGADRAQGRRDHRSRARGRAALRRCVRARCARGRAVRGASARAVHGSTALARAHRDRRDRRHRRALAAAHEVTRT